MPEALRQRPPEDRFCDLVLTGGVASGVVYPWALVELARHYRFRRIGGNSVGAMAAVLAAAAEYGRCTGQDGAFEVLRQSPIDLAEAAPDGRTRMERLFQPAPGVQRLFDCAIKGIRHANDEDVGTQPLLKAVLTVRDVLSHYHLFAVWLLGSLAVMLPALLAVSRLASGLVVAFAGLILLRLQREPEKTSPEKRARFLLGLFKVLAVAHVLAAVALVLSLWPAHGLMSLAWGLYALLLQVLGILAWTVVVLVAFGLLLIPEVQAFKENGYGLCPGKAQPDENGKLKEKALVEWLHEGVQRSIGRDKEDAPLTFAELWSAPRKVPLAPGEESISLQMFSTNLTLGRPLVWPQRDPNVRLFFRHGEWERFFPPTLLDALWKASAPYRPLTDGDPPVPDGDEYRELPAGGMPIVVAARLSLSFPVLFSCIPVYAVDYAGPRGQRVLRQCQLTDGGICTNFPIHLFDAAHPKWPTFGLLLSRRLGKYRGESLWLPERPDEGRADSWSRGVPGASEDGSVPGPLGGLFGLFGALFGTALRWNDNLLTRLPHVRNRVLRINLLAGEGELHITMPPKTIMKMASEYGTCGGRMLAKRFVSDTGVPTEAWREHLYVRTMNELKALATHLHGYADAVTAGGFNKPVADILKEAISKKPMRSRDGWPRDPLGDPLSPAQAAALQEAVDAIAALARTLEAKQAGFGPYEPIPTTRFHLRSQI
nr:patatin-like phospholipase family protein [Ramlibacter agri]